MTRATSSSVPDLPSSKYLEEGGLISGKYRLIRQIGEGAMGSVWVAKNEVLDVDVAIKFMRIDSPRSDPSNMYKRLLQEARAAARLGHPAIVRVFDFGRTADDMPFIVMELLTGEPLSGVLAREGKLEETRALQMMLPIADALATAHGRGIVHRDIKPENIFIARDEYGRLQPKIVDFGIARFAEGTGTLTRSGALLGTPDYMSPEQARGEPDIDHRADVWALCVVLYEMMSGRRPFGHEGANYLAVLRAIVHDPVKPTLDFGVGDKALWVIIERGLRKRRQERWDTMRVFGEAAALWLYERGIREDAFGASLKTGWLQAGIDGVKIDTTSMMPQEGEDALRVMKELDLALSPPSTPNLAELTSNTTSDEPAHSQVLPPTLLDASPAPPTRDPTKPSTPRATALPSRAALLVAVAATAVAVAAVVTLVTSGGSPGPQAPPNPAQATPPSGDAAIALSTTSPPQPEAQPEPGPRAAQVDSSAASEPNLDATVPEGLEPVATQAASGDQSAPSEVRTGQEPPARKVPDKAPAKKPAAKTTQKKARSFDLGF